MTHSECLADVWAVLLLQAFLKRRRLTVRTDYDRLKGILKHTDSTGKLAFWRPRFLEFQFDMVYWPGTKHKPADALSQLKKTGSNERPIEDDLLVLHTKAFIPVERRGKGYVMQGLRVLNEKEVIGHPAIYAIATWTGTEHYDRPITTPDLIQEHVGES